MKVVLITGISRGIGLATAKKLLAEGWEVIGTSTSGAVPLEHPHLSVIQLDYLDPNGVATAVANIHRLGKKKIDVLVNNAGTAEEVVTDRIDMTAFRKTLAVNLIGTIDFTNQILDLLSNPAHIINISSHAGGMTDIELSWLVPAYKISKVGINMFTQVMAKVWKQRGITISSLDPGWVQTDMGGAGAPRRPEEPAEEIYMLAASNAPSGQFWRSGKKRSW